MTRPPSRVRIRTADLTTQDASTVGGLVRAYLVQTEQEKAERGLAEVPGTLGLPDSYLPEVTETARAYDGYLALLAEMDGTAVGVAVVRSDAPTAEIKRLWADPEMRGRGIGAALLDAAIAACPESVRLSVWDWRRPAIGLYESRGFERVEPWDPRPRLICLQRAR